MNAITLKKDIEQGRQTVNDAARDLPRLTVRPGRKKVSAEASAQRTLKQNAGFMRYLASN